MPLDAATRTEPDVLHEGALATSALDQADCLERPSTLAGAPTAPAGAPRGGVTPASKTGVGGSVKRPERAAEAREAWLSVLEDGLKVSGDTWKRWATSKGRDQAALNTAVAESLQAFVKAEGLAMAEKLPFGKVVMVSFELSLAFAEGVGRGIERVNAENAKRWDFSRLSQEMTAEDVERVNSMRGYLSNNTQQLNRVIAEGLKDVVDNLMEKAFEKLGEIPGKVLDQVVGQLVGQLVKQNDLLAIFREAVDAAGKSIPEGRAKVEKLAFHFAATAYLNQMANKDLQAKLADLPGVVKADKPVDVALLGTIIKMLAENSYATYKKHVAVEYATGEVREMLLTTARRLAAGLVDVKLEDSGSAAIVVEKDRVALPTAWLAAMTEDPDTARELGSRAWARSCELADFVKRLRLGLEERRRLYVRKYRHESPSGELEVHLKWQRTWEDDWRRARQQAAAAVDAIIDEVGEQPGYSRTSLELTVQMHLLRPNEVGMFTPW